MTAVMALCGALLSYATQVFTETTVSHEHLCHPVGDFAPGSLHPFGQTGADRPLPLEDRIPSSLVLNYASVSGDDADPPLFRSPQTFLYIVEYILAVSSKGGMSASTVAAAWLTVW